MPFSDGLALRSNFTIVRGSDVRSQDYSYSVSYPLHARVLFTAKAFTSTHTSKIFGVERLLFYCWDV